jgi:hypothetical protein
MIERIARQEFYIKKMVKSAPDGGGSSRPIPALQGPLYGVVTRVNTSDAELPYSNVLTRQKRIRTFTDVDITYKDIIVLNGEEWRIVGEPEQVASMMNPRMKSTLLIIEKEGIN